MVPANKPHLAQLQILKEQLGASVVAIGLGWRSVQHVEAVLTPPHYTELDGVEKERTASLFETVELLLERHSAKTIRTWLCGTNYLLEDRSPLLCIRDDPWSSDVAAAVEDFYEG